MSFRLTSPNLSLKARLIVGYLVILGIGGLATSLVGSRIVSSTIMMQARRAVDHDFVTASTVYNDQLHAVQLAVQFAASGSTIPRELGANDRGALQAYLGRVRAEAGLDFLSLADAGGKVVLRAGGRPPAENEASAIGVAKAALAGKLSRPPSC